MGILKSLFGEKSAEVAPRAQLDFPIVIEGHGVSLAPKLPCAVAQLEGETLVLAYSPEDELKNALVKPGAEARSEEPTQRTWQGEDDEGFWLYRNRPSGTAIALGAGVAAPKEVFERIEAGATGPWRLHAPDFVIEWPEAFTLRTTLGQAPYPFELAYQGSEDMYLYLQGPFCGPEKIPSPETLVGPGQTVVGQGVVEGSLGDALWLELEYRHDGETWRQRFYYVVYDSECVFLLKAQVREAMGDSMWEACSAIVASFRPRH